MTYPHWLIRFTTRGTAVALAAVMGAGLFSLSTPSVAADGRYYRLPDGSVEYVRDRDLREWRRWQERRDRDADRNRRWRDDGRYRSPYDNRNSGELGDSRRDRRFDDRDWNRGNPWERRKGGRYHQYPADGA
ncbi:hypothetical protein [Ottowia beijingensis]|uniref:hypothetical protein n=1 Tax=Ottowia beijingensis TaxID=1207057 RepID=UPI002FDB2F30